MKFKENDFIVIGGPYHHGYMIIVLRSLQI